ncbi:hypothetical protein BU23DRAFT_243086 [Bimuria novae-zelandiae CBS 107.79]|uniref:Uncharacterized protein n=1 Tax=Bimuria novae-zelandiae CBS 107.79 TaxID=1447943 RepID=A0A6A5UVV9_9PLEO|nr:hypothetical protein BU23DRAFT_243086 [Bimuria novae-zelandiae CBS 107.79]
MPSSARFWVFVLAGARVDLPVLDMGGGGPGLPPRRSKFASKDLRGGNSLMTGGGDICSRCEPFDLSRRSESNQAILRKLASDAQVLCRLEGVEVAPGPRARRVGVA